jgi:hypothetical protein
MRVEVSASNTGERTIALAPTRGEEKARISEGPVVLHDRKKGFSCYQSLCGTLLLSNGLL